MFADSVLIFAKFAHDDKTEVLRCMGQWFEMAGISVTYLARTHSNKKILKELRDDGFTVKELQNLSDFYPTSANYGVVVFGDMPAKLHLYWCRQNKVHSVVLGDICNASTLDVDTLKYASCCIVPTSSATIGWRRNDIGNALYLPVIPRAAIPRRSYKITPDAQVLLPLWGPLAHRTAFTALSLIERYLHASESGEVVVGYTPSTLHPEATKRCKKLAKRYQRLTLTKADTTEEKLITIRDCDLVLYPAVHDKYGWIPSLALLAGVPLLGTASDMNQEILADTSSILLEPAKVSRSSLNNDLNEPDYEAFDACLQDIATGKLGVLVDTEAAMRAMRIRSKFFDSGMFRITTLGA